MSELEDNAHSWLAKVWPWSLDDSGPSEREVRLLCEFVRAQLAAVTKERDEARAGFESGEPPKGSRLWRCELELTKARAERDEAQHDRDAFDEARIKLMYQLETALGSLEYYANGSNLSPDIGLEARKAIAAIRAQEEKTCTCSAANGYSPDPSLEMHDPNCPQHGRGNR